MTSETGSPDPYELVLADLRAKREQIDNAIAAIEGLRGGQGVAHKTSIHLSGGSTGSITGKVVPGEGHLNESAFLGMTIPEAAIQALKIKRRKLPNVEMVAILKAGGLEMNSTDPVNTVGSVLTRRADKVGDIVKVGRGIWGLKEWYPNRSFRRQPAPGETPEGQADATDPSPSEPERPSELHQTSVFD